MSGASGFSIAPRIRRFAITIPAAAGTAVTLYSLVVASLNEDDKSKIIGGRVNRAPADYVAGDSATSLPVTVTTTEAYEEPCANFLKATYVKASTGLAISASVSVWLAGDGRFGLS